MKGIKSCFRSRIPTFEEVRSCKDYTNKNVLWDPHSDDFHIRETLAIENSYGSYPHDQCTISPVNQKSATLYNLELSQISNVYNDDQFSNLTIASTNTQTRTLRLTPQTLAQRWVIGLKAAKQTLKATTQRGVHYALGLVKCRFKTKQAQLRYRQLSS